MKRRNHLFTLLTISLLTINFFAYSQGCLPEGIDFYTQEEIDNFQTNYPGCTEIEGDVHIWDGYNDDDIMNLNGLNALTSIGGRLQIKGTDSLKNLSGLGNLATIGGELVIRENLSLTNLIGLENLTSVDEKIWIWMNDTLTSLEGLDNLNYVGGELYIRMNDALISLEGLSNLNYVGDDIRIASNASLISIGHLESLTYIHRDLTIWKNQSLTSLMGLHNITSIFGTLWIYGGSLSDLTGLNNLTSIGFNLKIWDARAGLSGLDNLTTVWGSCEISGCNSLKDLTGLNNLSFIGNEFEVSNNDSLMSLNGLDNLTTIGGNFVVCENESLINLAGLENINSIDGSLLIGFLSYDQYGQVFGVGNPAMTNLTGLNYLESIGGDLYLISNPVLNDLSALENLTTVHSITIGKQSYLNECGNPSLTNLYGLHNINPSILGNVYIGYNESLSTCDINSICEYLATTNNSVEIENNASGCSSPAQVEAACESHCFPEGIVFTTQQQIDDFQTNYPDCSVIEGDVVINGYEISNLNGINNIEAIGGNLEIINNPDLSSLNGLENIISIGNNLSITDNNSLINLDGLSSLNHIYNCLFIDGNQELANINILNNIYFLNGDLSISNNASMQNLVGLENLISIGGNLLLENNNNLESIMALSNLNFIDGELNIINNGALLNLYGLDNLVPSSITGLSIIDNDNLTTCHIQSVCSYFLNPGGAIEIYNNSPGCNSEEEVANECPQSAHETQELKQEIQIFPNPAKEEITIHCLGNIQIKKVCIFNQTGKKLVCKKGIEKTIDISEMQSGLYFVEIISNLGSYRKKLIIQ